MCIVNASKSEQQNLLNVSNAWLINVLQTIESELRSYYRLSYLRAKFGSVCSQSHTSSFFQHQVLSDIYVNQEIDLSIDYYEESLPFALRATTITDYGLSNQQYKLHLPSFWRNYISSLFTSSEGDEFCMSEEWRSDIFDIKSLFNASSSRMITDRIPLPCESRDAMLLVRKNEAMSYELIRLSEDEKADFRPILSAEACAVSMIQI